MTSRSAACCGEGNRHDRARVCLDQATSARRLLTGSEPATVRSHRATVLRAGVRSDQAAAAWRLLTDVSQVSHPWCTVLVVIHGPPDFYSCSYGIGPAGVRRSARAQEGKLTDWATPPHPEGGRTVEHHLAADSGTHWATGQVREKRWCAMLRGLRRPKIFCVRQSWTGESAHTQ